MTKEKLVLNWEKLNVKPELISAFTKTPRENFVPPQYSDLAYDDRPLPTIRQQSISQPSTIMLMLQALELKQGMNVLEIGAGVGYQASMLGLIVGNSGKVTSLDVVPELVHIAKKNVANLEINNTSIIEADGSEGFIDNSPYDRIIITAACPSIPEPLIEQLKEEGIIVAPVGDLKGQTMVKAIKKNGKLVSEYLGSFAFVPMKGKHGFKEIELMD